jgi:DNA-binding transcriptional LysR family regulator
VLTEYGSEELGIYALYPSRRHLSAKVRSFIDFLAARWDGAGAAEHSMLRRLA